MKLYQIDVYDNAEIVVLAETAQDALDYVAYDFDESEYSLSIKQCLFKNLIFTDAKNRDNKPMTVYANVYN